MSDLKKITAGALFLVALSGAAQAAPTLLNGNFETAPPNTTSTPPNWTAIGGTTPSTDLRRVYEKTGAQGVIAGAAQGSYWALFRGQATSGGGGYETGISQLVTGLTPGQTYDLDFMFASTGSTPNSFSITIAGNTFYPLGDADGINIAATSPSAGSWQTQHFTFTATATSETLAFKGKSFSGAAFGVDNVQITEQVPGVPEIDAVSGTGAITLILGAIGLINEKRRRYHQ